MGVIKEPIITEKYSALNEKGVYAFVVDAGANKIQIKSEVEGKYGVNVVKVNTMRMAPKRSTRYTKSGFVAARKSGYKKAMVYLPDGEFIDYYEDL